MQRRDATFEYLEGKHGASKKLARAAERISAESGRRDAGMFFGVASGGATGAYAGWQQKGDQKDYRKKRARK